MRRKQKKATKNVDCCSPSLNSSVRLALESGEATHSPTRLPLLLVGLAAHVALTRVFIYYNKMFDDSTPLQAHSPPHTHTAHEHRTRTRLFHFLGLLHFSANSVVPAGRHCWRSSEGEKGIRTCRLHRALNLWYLLLSVQLTARD